MTLLSKALLPLPVILVLVAWAGKGIIGQVAVYLVSTELSHRQSSLLREATGLAQLPPPDPQRWLDRFLSTRDQFGEIQMALSGKVDFQYPPGSQLTPPQRPARPAGQPGTGPATPPAGRSGAQPGGRPGDQPGGRPGEQPGNRPESGLGSGPRSGLIVKRDGDVDRLYVWAYATQRRQFGHPGGAAEPRTAGGLGQ